MIILTKQLLISNYNDIEKERKILKAKYYDLKDNNGDPKQIKEIGTKLTALTFNQCWILVDLENYR